MCSQRTLPDPKSRQRTFHSCSGRGASRRAPPKYSPFLGGSTWPELIAVVRNTFSPQTIGDDQPRPGISVFHETFSVLDHRSGRFVLVLTPWAPGPRNCGQLLSGNGAPDAFKTANRIPGNTNRERFIFILKCF